MAGNYSIGLDQIKKRLGEQRVMQLTDDAGVGAIDTGNVDDAIVAAENEFHLYAGVYYAIPVRESDSSIPDGVKDLLTDSACVRLMDRRPEFLGDEGEGRYWERRRKEIFRFLEMISSPDRKLVLADATERTAAVVTTGGASQESDDVTYSHDSMKEW